MLELQCSRLPSENILETYKIHLFPPTILLWSVLTGILGTSHPPLKLSFKMVKVRIKVRVRVRVRVKVKVRVWVKVKARVSVRVRDVPRISDAVDETLFCDTTRSTVHLAGELRFLFLQH